MTPTPYGSNAEFLTEAIRALTARCKRIAARRKVVEATRHGEDATDAERLVTLAAQAEKSAKDHLDTRVAAHRRHGTFVLGLDRLVHEADLDEEATLILIGTLIPALSEDMAAKVFDGLDMGCIWTSLTGEGVLRVLDATTIDDILRIRRHLLPGSPLLQHDLVAVDQKKADLPEDLTSSRVRITSKAFDILTGQADA